MRKLERLTGPRGRREEKRIVRNKMKEIVRWDELNVVLKSSDFEEKKRFI